MKYIFGGYGRNNLGDEAIFQGAKKLYPGIIQLYVNVSREPNAIWYADLLTGKVKFDDKATELIIGGGGIAHCKGNIEDLHAMAVLAKAQGMRVSIQRVGLEGAHISFERELKQLLGIADSISVRTETSRQIALDLGVDTIVEQDFAYELDIAVPHNEHNDPTIGVSLGELKEKDFPIVANNLKVILKHANVDFMVHSKAYVSHTNHDLITALKLQTMLDLWQDNGVRLNNFTIFDRGRVNLLMQHYKGCNGVYTTRYHGMIFADMAKVPMLTTSTTLKTRSFFEDKTAVNKHRMITIDQEQQIEAWVKEVIK